jgi:hypothetical protein
MVAGAQDFRHVHPAKRGRARVDGGAQEVVLERIGEGGARVPQRAGLEAHERVDQDERRQLAAAQDIIADGNLARDPAPAHAFVDAFVSPGHENDILLA